MTENYFRVVQQGSDQASEVNRILQPQLLRIKADLGDINIEGVCLMADVGEFVIHALEILGRFATEVIYGQDLVVYTQHWLEQLEEQGLADLDVADYLDDKHSALK